MIGKNLQVEIPIFANFIVSFGHPESVWPTICPELIAGGRPI